MAAARSGGVRRRSSRVVREQTLGSDALPSVWRVEEAPAHRGALLLDTHIWFWMLTGDTGTMAPATKSLIERAARDGRLYVSDISHWEIALLVSKGRIDVGEDVAEWLKRAAQAPGITAAPLAREVLVRSTRLPGDPHPDPADRMLMAQAQLLGASLVTCDRSIVACARRAAGIPVCDARA
jgi:PIN domain nuclease of toxin-antitoxin system